MAELTSTAFETLLVETPQPHVMVVTLNRPAVRNALNTAMMTDLRDLFQQVYISCGGVRAIIITLSLIHI